MVFGMNALKERVTWLENLVGEPTDENHSLTDRLDVVASGFLALETSTADRFKEVMADMLTISDAWKDKLQNMEDELSILKKAVCGHSNSGESTHSKIKVPNPKAFGDAHNAKELENFLWDM